MYRYIRAELLDYCYIAEWDADGYLDYGGANLPPYLTGISESTAANVGEFLREFGIAPSALDE
jgi:hypothetical protein